MLPLHLLTIFLGAGLLFLVQPLVGRMVLPAYGGSPAVWNTCLLFFQSALLAGYLLVHLLSRRGVAVQMTAIGLLLAAGLIALPFALGEGRGAHGAGSPIPDLLAALAVTAGLPFLAVSMISPLLQRWFSVSGHLRSGDPYFLYAASNAGSLLGLLAYPLLVERLLPIAGQAKLWTVMYAALLLLVGACAVTLLRAGRSPAQSVHMLSTPEGPPARNVSTLHRAYWVFLAFVPSSLLMSVTSFITADLVVVPLLWVIPLGLYLISYILAFAVRGGARASADANDDPGGESGRARGARHAMLLPIALLRRGVPIAVVTATILFVSGATEPIWLIVTGHLAVLLMIATAAHGELALRRPDPAQLTGFYLCISIGGALGGVFNALLAPAFFPGMAEYPITLIAAAALIPATGTMLNPARRSLLISGAAVAGLFALVLLMGRVTPMIVPAPGPVRLAMLFGVPVVLAFLASRQSLRFAAALTAILIAGLPSLGPGGDVLERSRSFYGMHRVMRLTPGPVHALYHGTTLHGIQLADAETGLPADPLRPLAYYTRSGPIGDVFTLHTPRRTGLVGLGAGTLAAYAQPDSAFTFFEIDPDVARIAQDERFFSYISAARRRGASIDVVLGDARLTLRDTPPGTFDLLVIDAFSSDSIPAHLLTREALALYVQSLRSDGLLAMHISNRYINLEPVVANLARDAGLSAVLRTDYFSADAPDAGAGRLTSTWIVMAREEEALAALRTPGASGTWRAPQEDPRVGVWTDDWSDILQVLLR